MSPNNIPFDKVLQVASTVALASPEEINKSETRFNNWNKKTDHEKENYKNQLKKQNKKFYEPTIKNGKVPAISWNKQPKGYKSYNDKYYGSGVICSYIPSLKYYLAVIDLDMPKNDDDIPMKAMLDATKDLIPQTVTHQTPSGGYHIYLLSEEKPQATQPHFNLDYQTNTNLDKKGKYVVANFRYSKNNDDEYIKEYYKKCPKSPDNIMIVKNSDDILNKIINQIKESGFLKTPIKKAENDENKLIKIFRKNYREGSRNNFALAIAGYLYKNNYTQAQTSRIINKVFEDDEELDSRAINVTQTYNKSVKEVSGWIALKEHLNPQDHQNVQDLVKNSEKTLKDKIFLAIENNKQPSYNLLADYINSKKKLFYAYESLKYYELDDKESLTEIDVYEIMKFCNQEFEYNNISKTTCQQVFPLITHLIEKDYERIEFTNGTLFTNDNKIKFKENWYGQDKIPKMKIPFNWEPDAEGGEIQKMIDDRLKTDKIGFEDNKDTFLKSVGCVFMSTNEIEKMVILVGRSGTGKSTIMTLLKHIFEFSELSLPTIVKSERFALYPAVDKDINIDDDIQSGTLKNIGNLKSFTTGNGGEVEKKGENERIKLTLYNTPRIFGCGNSLPIMNEEGFERRLLLIIADNPIKNNEKRKSFQTDIIVGKMDKQIEWLIYTAITKYQETRDKPIIDNATENFMQNEWSKNSNPLNTAIKQIFDLTLDEDVKNFKSEKFLPVDEAELELMHWYDYARNENIILNTNRLPSKKQISATMDYNMFQKGEKRYKDKNGVEQRTTVYKHIKINEEWKKTYNNWQENM
ncbi:DUF5906 domain-containing protein [Methanobrevibacter sp. UBA417]|mgnify:CR=1 FL=1|jgi:energy-coupling factor transporter ATP-binding protein EcfA2|uniref:DUF5906 domain-containing protein n=1 Tax=Methanobrevibacter sp. UBA417 TaxID=1915487 RepID=UPI0039B970DB